MKNILSKDYVLLGLRGGWTEVLNELVAPLVENNIIADRDRFLEDIDARERQITMQVSPLVALPHARSNAVRRLGLSVGICNEGISYADGSEPNCRLLFLIAIPAFAPTAHMPLLQHLAAFAHDASRVQKLLEVSTPGRATTQITRFSGRR